MKAVYKKPGEKCQLIDVADNYQELQRLIGGYIELHQLSDTVYLLCDEDGRMKGLPSNVIVAMSGRGLVSFCGDVLLVGRTVDAQFTDISDEDAREYGAF